MLMGVEWVLHNWKFFASSRLIACCLFLLLFISELGVAGNLPDSPLIATCYADALLWAPFSLTRVKCVFLPSLSFTEGSMKGWWSRYIPR